MMKPATTKTTYEPVVGWPAVPHGFFLHEATSVGMDSQDRVYVFNRGQWPMIIFDKEGNFLDAWGAGEFDIPHGISFDAADNMYLADNANFVQKRTSDGEVLLTLGARGVDKPRHTGGPFNSPTHVAIDPRNGDWFVSDGYRNSSVHRFDAAGKHMMSWGESGSGPGQFALLHNVWVDSRGRVFICDRENNRVQIFDAHMNFVDDWRHFGRPSGVAILADDRLFVADSESGRMIFGELRNPGWKNGVRFGSARDGSLQGFIDGTDPEGLAVDELGNVWAGLTSTPILQKWVEP